MVGAAIPIFPLPNRHSNLMYAMEEMRRSLFSISRLVCFVSFSINPSMLSGSTRSAWRRTARASFDPPSEPTSRSWTPYM